MMVLLLKAGLCALCDVVAAAVQGDGQHTITQYKRSNLFRCGGGGSRHSKTMFPSRKREEQDKARHRTPGDVVSQLDTEPPGWDTSVCNMDNCGYPHVLRVCTAEYTHNIYFGQKALPIHRRGVWGNAAVDESSMKPA